jgi:hypothetical protein
MSPPPTPTPNSPQKTTTNHRESKLAGNRTQPLLNKLQQNTKQNPTPKSEIEPLSKHRRRKTPAKVTAHNPRPLTHSTGNGTLRQKDNTKNTTKREPPKVARGGGNAGEPPVVTRYLAVQSHHQSHDGYILKDSCFGCLGKRGGGSSLEGRQSNISRE